MGIRPVIVCGAGLSGLSAAVALTRIGVPVRLLEANAGVGSDPSGMILWNHAIRLLDRLGIGPRLRLLGLPMLHGEIWSPHGQLLTRWNTEDVDSPADVAVVERNELRQLLLEELPPNTAHFECE